MQKIHRHAWLWEPLEVEAGFLLRTMFGAKAVYLDGKMMLCFCDSDEPWRGLLVCTSREHHPALRVQFPELSSHPILSKWLYLPETFPNFERTGTTIVRLTRQRDPRIGITPKPRKRCATKARSPRK